MSKKDRASLCIIEADDISAEDITGDSARIVGKIQSTHIANPLGIQYFSAAPFLTGSPLALPWAGEESPTEVRL